MYSRAPQPARSRTALRLVAGVTLLAAWQAMILGADYRIDLTAQYAIVPGPLGNAVPCLAVGNLETKAREIHGVRRYAVTSSGFVIGEGPGEYFIGAPAGTIERFQDEFRWRAAGADLTGGSDAMNRLVAPSRLRDQRLQRRELAWGVVAAAWFVTLLWPANRWNPRKEGAYGAG